MCGVLKGRDETGGRINGYAKGAKNSKIADVFFGFVSRRALMLHVSVRLMCAADADLMQLRLTYMTHVEEV